MKLTFVQKEVRKQTRKIKKEERRIQAIKDRDDLIRKIQMYDARRQKQLDIVMRLANSDTFLESYEWHKVRMEALKKYGARCQCCGATPADGIVINVDHIKPRRHFPHLALSINNLQVLCGSCNHGKGNWDMTDWRESAHR